MPPRWLDLHHPDELARFQRHSSLAPFDSEDLLRHGPDVHQILLGPEGLITGHCSLWWRNTPSYNHHRLGLIGHYGTSNAAVSVDILSQACATLRAQACTLAVAPINGNTWRPYRLVTETGREPPFLFEPANPLDWPALFQSQGFQPIAHYTSALNDDLSPIHPHLTGTERILAESGIRIRQLRLADFDHELRRIHQVTTLSFERSFLYSPITEEEFLSQFRPLRTLIRPELILLAERDSELIGYLFALPDQLQARRGEPVRSVIIKTVAVLPDHGRLGLGTFLVGRSQIIARELGYKRVIHALMQESNPSQRISGHCARPIRRYALFAKAL